MKKLIAIVVVALLCGSGIAGAETMAGGGPPAKPMMAGEPQPGGGGAPPAEAQGQPGKAGMPGAMEMSLMGQAMMPNMMNMMMASPPVPGSMPGGQMMNMPLMGASMMPMGMGGLGMMPLMMGGTSEEAGATLERYRAFLKETKEARKELHDLAFIYFEARWTPETTVKEMQEMAFKMRKLRDEIMAKMPK